VFDERNSTAGRRPYPDQAGYRLRAERDGDRVRPITRGGYDWTKRYPWIVEAALPCTPASTMTMQLYAFDILSLDSDDLRALPLSMHKVNLERLLARRPQDIFLNSFEHGEIGPDLFRKACEFGLEGIVSKRADRPHRAADRRTGSR
jgi:bifunctional non-homologous end joining protein LigD